MIAIFRKIKTQMYNNEDMIIPIKNKVREIKNIKYKEK